MGLILARRATWLGLLDRQILQRRIELERDPADGKVAHEPPDDNDCSLRMSQLIGREVLSGLQHQLGLDGVVARKCEGLTALDVGLPTSRDQKVGQNYLHASL